MKTYMLTMHPEKRIVFQVFVKVELYLSFTAIPS